MVLSSASAVPTAAARGQRRRVEEQLPVRRAGGGGQGLRGDQGRRPMARVVQQVALLSGTLESAAGGEAEAVRVLGQFWGGVGEAGPVDAEHRCWRTFPRQFRERVAAVAMAELRVRRGMVGDRGDGLGR